MVLYRYQWIISFFHAQCGGLRDWVRCGLEYSAVLWVRSAYFWLKEDRREEGRGGISGYGLLACLSDADCLSIYEGTNGRIGEVGRTERKGKKRGSD